MNPSKALRPLSYIALLFIIIATGGCEQEQAKKTVVVDVKPTFKSVWGRKFTEVKRRMADGLSIDKYGYQQEPTWQITFPNDDSASIYSPDKDKFYYFPVTFDHDSAVNMARSWLRIRKVTRDSLVFKVMKVEDKTIYLNVPDLFMTFYADDYIKNKLKTTAEILRRPGRADSALVKKMSAYVNTHPDTAFAARQPVVFTSTSPNVKVAKAIDKIEVISLKNAELADAYMTPEYNITINKAYKDFSYSFSAYVDNKGKIIFRASMVELGEDFAETKIRIMKALIEGYLKAYLRVTPGSTFGITHTSVVILNVTGIK